MLDEATMAVTTGAAGNIVAYMLNGRMDALRTRVARVFRHGTDEQHTRPLHALEADAASLAGRQASEAEIAARWTALLISYLASHPEAREDVVALASLSGTGKTTTIGSQKNLGSGTFIGGDNYGDINVTSRPEA
ncbi:hypothetical protein [Kitasatospora sp. NPDC059803]|uniref:hypothetical protein n=1 Tax=Kitasatospora sp. NPDC059803 TaxID=3346953 RepID=UPI003660410C